MERWRRTPCKVEEAEPELGNVVDGEESDVLTSKMEAGSIDDKVVGGANGTSRAEE
jgi:hypothetical protein